MPVSLDCIIQGLRCVCYEVLAIDVLFCCFCLSGWKKGNDHRTACSTIVSFLFFCSCFWALLFLDSDDKVTENCGQSSCGDA